MYVGSTLSMSRNSEATPEVSHRDTRPSPLSTTTATPLMGKQNLDNIKRGITNPKSTVIDSDSRKRPILAIRTVSPPVQQATDNTSPVSPMTTRPSLDPVPIICSNLRDMQLGSDIPPANGYSWKGKARADGSFQHGTKERKRKRNEPTFPSKIRDILEWRTMKVGTDLDSRGNGDHGSAKKAKKVTGGMQELWTSRQTKSPKDKGPRAGQLYEIVNRHIIEDSVDKTVTISTWRERVDQGQRSDADTMSIYYISPDGFAHEGAYATGANAKFERRPPGLRHGSKRENQGTSYGPVEADCGPSTKSRVNGSRHAQYNDIDSTATDPLERKNTKLSTSNTEKHRAKEGGARSNSSPWGPFTNVKAQDGSFIRRQRQYQESTPIEKNLPPLPSPFHPTRSGSTISSIRSVSTGDFEKFLDGCKPSLVHVSDILKSLGIYKLEHLKVVARLSPETRDREVKEDALRLGMTVMEWAILVDNMLKI